MTRTFVLAHNRRRPLGPPHVRSEDPTPSNLVRTSLEKSFRCSKQLASLIHIDKSWRLFACSVGASVSLPQEFELKTLSS